MKRTLMMLSGILICWAGWANQADLEKKIWAHQAILAVYQVSHDNYIADQKEIAHYFTASAWKKYLQGLDKINYQQFIDKNYYRVSCVALKPVELKSLPQSHWQATLPVLVQYKNPQYAQLQSLQVTIQFKQAPSGQGVRGYQLVSFQSKQIDKPCRCMLQKGKVNLNPSHQ